MIGKIIQVSMLLVAIHPALIFGQLVESDILLEKKAPKIEEADRKEYLATVGEEVLIFCTASGKPIPNLTWSKIDGQNLTTLGIVIEETSQSIRTTTQEELFIRKATLVHRGWYKCVARNSEGIHEISFRIIFSKEHIKRNGFIESGNSETNNTRTSTQPRLDHGATASIVVVVVIVTLLGSAVCAELLRRKNRHGLSKRDVELFHKGSPGAIKQGYAHENAMLEPYDFTYELNKDKLKIDKDDILGTGVFGQVVRAKYEGKTVAVKMVKPGAEKSYLKALLTELKIMIHIGRHPYVCELVGATSKDLRRGMLNVVVTLYPLGSVESYLRGRRYMFVNQFSESGKISKTNDGGELCTLDLLRWSYQVADGMDYLEKRNIIHGDLASRNILLDEKKTAKITDFGLARKMYDYANYVKTQQEPLPWRWMAIESLQELTFSPKSDVWSYGVLLWEFFSCGDIPYPGYSWTTDFLNKLIAGLRLPRPKYASRPLYKGIMENCWQARPTSRITFATVALILKEYLVGEEI